MLSGPEILIREIAPTPGGDANANMLSFFTNLILILCKNIQWELII